MDINETLRLMRAAIAQRNEHSDRADRASEAGDFEEESDERTRAEVAGDDAAKYAEQIDEWLSGGGALPDAWIGRALTLQQVRQGTGFGRTARFRQVS